MLFNLRLIIKTAVLLCFLAGAFYLGGTYGVQSTEDDEAQMVAPGAGEYMFLRKRVRTVDQLRRFDVVRYRVPGAATGIERNARVIGLPGERVGCSKGTVTVNGEPLDETAYLTSSKFRNSQESWEPMVIPRGCVFLVVDRRGRTTYAQEDSRGVGPIPESLIQALVSRP